MARTVKREAKLETRFARARLGVGEEKHKKTMQPGKVHLVYQRKRAGVAGVFTVWRFVGKSPECKSGYRKSTLGVADDLAEANGVTVLSYDQAAKLAHATGAGEKAPEVTAIPTVAEAATDQVSYLRTKNARAGDGAEQNFRLHILPVLGTTRLDRLTLKQLEVWWVGMVSKPARNKTTPLSKKTAKRIWNDLRAALNRACRHHPGLSDHAWRQFKPFAWADVARPGCLTVAEAQRLINACDPAFRSLVEGALATGCRYGELTRLRVADFARGRVTIRESKSGKPRVVRLTDEGAGLFAGLCAGRPGDQLIFRRADGGPWKKSHQARPMRAACVIAGITPAVGFHQLRHTWASLSVMAGMPLMLVAETPGHSSVQMVTAHYAHLSPDYKDRLINETAPRFGISPAAVVPLDERREANR